MSTDVEPSDLWLRLRFQRHRLPREYPVSIPPEILLRQVLKRLGRDAGYCVMELFAASERAPACSGPQPTPQGDPEPAEGE